ncbi:hypothetical protein MY7_0296 [Bacillus sp. 5B6]|nr:hypothetical protein MY7_0296 [Bacillus sp. 5B6]
MCKWLRQTGRRLAEKRRRPVHRRDHQLWENRQAYDDFMENEHDRIYEEIEQKAAILSIEVMLYEEDEPFIHELLHHPDIRYEPDWTVQKA